MEEIRYSLRHKKKNLILGFYTSSNAEGDFCTDTEHILGLHCENVWETNKAWKAEYVRRFPTPWYNADYETPNHHFDPDELEVVERRIITNPITVKFPTKEEMLEFKCKKYPSDRKQIMYFANEAIFDYYDYYEFFRKED